MQQCDDCARFYFYPRSACRYCGSRDVAWRQTSGRGVLASYIINQRPPPGYEPGVPIVMALVELTEGPRLLTNILGTNASPGSLPLGAPVVVDFVPRGDQVLPMFRLVEGKE